MAVKTLLLALLPVLAAGAARPSCSPGEVCLAEEAEDGSLIQKRAQGARAARKAAGAAEAARAGDPCITASGTRSTEGPTDLGDFSAVSVSGNVEVKFQTGSSSSYTVSADSAVMEHISVEVQGSTLEVQMTGNVCWTGSWTAFVAIVTVTAPAFPSQITVSGQAEFEHVGDSATVGTLTVDASDQGEVDLPDVSAYQCTLTAQDQAEIKSVTCSDLEVTAGDQSQVKLTLTGSATGSASGQAELKVYGGGSTSGIAKSNQAVVKNKS